MPGSVVTFSGYGVGSFPFGRVPIMALVITMISQVRPKDVSHLNEPVAGHLGLLVFSTSVNDVVWRPSGMYVFLFLLVDYFCWKNSQESH